jgi:mannose-1-phosphate guanylyltransferase / phosphomannomutase
LAGGRGSRLGSITDKIAKPMVEVAGRPVIEHVVNLLKEYGVREFIFTLGYLPETVSSYFGNGSKFGINIKYLIEDTPLGTAGAVLGARKFVNDDFVVTAGDVLRKLDIDALVEAHKRSGAVATIGLFKIFKEARSRVLVDKEGFITKFVEHPPEIKKRYGFVWSNDSFYVFKPEIFKYILESKNKDSMVDFGKDVFPAMIKKGVKINTFIGNKYIIDIGTPEGLKKARKTFIP